MQKPRLPPEALWTGGAAKALASIRRVEDARRFFMVPVEYLLAESGGGCVVDARKAAGEIVGIDKAGLRCDAGNAQVGIF